MLRRLASLNKVVLSIHLVRNSDVGHIAHSDLFMEEVEIVGFTDQQWFVVRFDCNTRVSTQVVIELQTAELNAKCALLSPVGFSVGILQR